MLKKAAIRQVPPPTAEECRELACHYATMCAQPGISGEAHTYYAQQSAHYDFLADCIDRANKRRPDPTTSPDEAAGGAVTSNSSRFAANL